MPQPDWPLPQPDWPLPQRSDCCADPPGSNRHETLAQGTGAAASALHRSWPTFQAVTRADEALSIAEHPAEEGIWRRGLDDAAKALSHTLSLVVVTAVDTVAAAAGAIWVARTKNPTTLEIGLGAAGGVVAGLLVVGLGLLAWSCVRAPIKQRDEARVEVDRLQRLVRPSSRFTT